LAWGVSVGVGLGVIIVLLVLDYSMSPAKVSNFLEVEFEHTYLLLPGYVFLCSDVQIGRLALPNFNSLGEGGLTMGFPLL
jgi:hypothetical protein